MLLDLTNGKEVASYHSTNGAKVESVCVRACAVVCVCVCVCAVFAGDRT